MQRGLAILLLFAAHAPVPAQIAAANTIAQQERNKAVAMRVFNEIFNQGNFQAADTIYAKDFVNHGLHRDANLAEDQAAARWEKTACPDLHLSVDLITASGDTVTVVWTARGRNTHRAGWLPPTGARIEERGITVWRFAGGRIHEEWTSMDEWQLMRQVARQLWWVEAGLVALLFLLDWTLTWIAGRLWAIVKQTQPAR